MKLTAVAFENFPEVKPNSNLSELIINIANDNEWDWCDGDIIVIAQKIISKSENQFVYLADVHPGLQAEKYSQITGKDPRLIELILSESNKVLMTPEPTLIFSVTAAYAAIGTIASRTNLLSACQTASKP